MPLSIAQRDHGPRPVLTVDGDLDLATAPELANLGLSLIEAGASDVVVDAERLTFCDSSGLSALVQIANGLGAGSGRLAIAGPTPMVRRVLEMSGLVDAFVVADTVPDALDILARGRAS
jgi:stage II sporulation protein AA (anti-sigma F factor antagonist)